MSKLRTAEEREAAGIARLNGYAVARELILANPENPRDMTSPETLANIAKLERAIDARGWDVNCPLLGWFIKDTHRTSDGAQPFLGTFPDERERFLQYDGHCRMVAVDRLTAKGKAFGKFPTAILPQGITPAERLAISLRYAGADLSAIDAANQIVKMQGLRMTNQEIVDAAGRDMAWLERCLAIRGADAPIRNGVETGIASASLAHDIIKHAADPVREYEAAVTVAKARGSEKVRPRDVAKVREAGKPAPTMSPEQKVLDRQLPILDQWLRRTQVRALLTEDVTEAFEKIRALLP
jgi:hypothetical protein